VLAQNVGSNTLAMLEIAVIISASPQVWCFGRVRPCLSHLDSLPRPLWDW